MERKGLRYVGLMAFIPITLAVGAVLFALFYGEWKAAFAFLVLAAILTVASLLLFRVAPRSANISHHSALMVPLLGLLIIIPPSALPYLWLSNVDPWSAVLEAVSGYVTCGATVFGYGGFQLIESLPRSLLFWRSATEWIGGIFLWLILGLLRAKQGSSLARAWGMERPPFDMRTLARQVSVVYVGMTLTSAILLILFGPMSAFDALNHAMTALATGGFSTRDAGLAFYNQPGYRFDAILVLISLTSLAGMSSFVWLSSLFIRGHIGALLRDESYTVDRREFALMFGLLLLLIGLMFSHYVWRKEFLPGAAFRQSAFYVITSMSGTGFNITDLSEWDAVTALVLVVGVVIGGSSCSASGGLSLATLNDILSALRKRIARKGRATALDVRESDALILAGLSMSLVIVSTILLLPIYGDRPLYAIVFQVAAAQANTGPQLLDLATIPPLAKLLYTLLMVGGFRKYSLLIMIGQRLISVAQ